MCIEKCDSLFETKGSRQRACNEITLTLEEAEYALYDARCEKYFAEIARKKKAQKSKELLDCLTPFTSAQLRENVLKNHPHFIVHIISDQADHFASGVLTI